MIFALAAGVAVAVLGLSLRYRRDLNAARARLAAMERHVVSTRWGAVEYAERGNGEPVLVGNLPGSPTAVVQPSSAKRVNRQLIMWALRTFAPSTTARLVAAVPKGFAMTSEDTRYSTTTTWRPSASLP